MAPHSDCTLVLAAPWPLLFTQPEEWNGDWAKMVMMLDAFDWRVGSASGNGFTGCSDAISDWAVDRFNIQVRRTACLGNLLWWCMRTSMLIDDQADAATTCTNAER
jgi:hypothetical protein